MHNMTFTFSKQLIIYNIINIAASNQGGSDPPLIISRWKNVTASYYTYIVS